MPTIPAGGPLSDAAISEDNAKAGAASTAETKKVQRSDAEWQEMLTPEQYEILRKKGTERPFTGALYNNHADGLYHCGACNAPLFKSDAKFESGSGWPMRTAATACVASRRPALPADRTSATFFRTAPSQLDSAFASTQRHWVLCRTALP